MLRSLLEFFDFSPRTYSSLKKEKYLSVLWFLHSLSLSLSHSLQLPTHLFHLTDFLPEVPILSSFYNQHFREAKNKTFFYCICIFWNFRIFSHIVFHYLRWRKYLASRQYWRYVFEYYTLQNLAIGIENLLSNTHVIRLRRMLSLHFNFDKTTVTK